MTERAGFPSLLGSEFGSEVLQVLPVADRLAEKPQRALPPFGVVIPRDHQNRGSLPQPLHKTECTLELPMPGTLGEISRHHDGAWIEAGHELFQITHLIQGDMRAKVNVRQVNEGQTHHVTRTR